MLSIHSTFFEYCDVVYTNRYQKLGVALTRLSRSVGQSHKTLTRACLTESEDAEFTSGTRSFYTSSRGHRHPPYDRFGTVLVEGALG